MTRPQGNVPRRGPAALPPASRKSFVFRVRQPEPPPPGNSLDSGEKGIDDVNGYRWAEWSRSPEACDDQQELDFHSLETLTLQHVVIDGDICSLPNRDGGIESQEGHRLKAVGPTGLSAATE